MSGKPRLVDVSTLIPDAVLDVRYATARNAARRVLYPFPAVFLLEPAALRLVRAAEGLRARGLCLRLFDGYRPLSVQRELWAALPDPRYVADPARGSMHNRGAAVDVGLCVSGGAPLPMPSDFDAFGPEAAHSGPNAALLRAAMEAAGFASDPREWWHYSDPALASSPLLDAPFELLRSGA